MIMAASQRARNSELKQSETWKRHIIRQLKYRNRTQTSVFQDLIESYHSLLEKSKQRALITKGILGSGSRPSLSEDSLTSLKTTTGELAYQVVELQQRIQLKEVTLDEQHTKLYEVQNHLSVLASEHSVLQERVVEVQTRNRLLKQEYDSLLEQHQNMERTYRQEKLRSSEILENMIGPKQQAAVRMNHRNEKRVRAREASLHKELQMAASKNVNIEESGNVSPPKPSSPKRDSSQRLERSHGPLFRSASATSPRIISSIRGLFERKMRGKSVCRSEEDLYIPLGVCLVARVPTKAIFTVDAHELGINAVRFSTSSNLLATGGTDRVIKLWGIEAGTLQNRGTLDGSNEGITSIEFDPTVTLTGHSRKVTAARFKYSQRQVVTGSADRTVKIWDLQRAACIQTIEVLSFCSDVVCSEYLIISSHYDRKIRFWDSRAGTCTQEVPLQGRVTSLDLCPNHRQLLSCSRDDILQLVDLRKSNDRVAFRAEGFKCGSDSTKAIFSPDGSFLAAGSADGAVYIWNVSTGNLEKRLPDMHRASISAVAWSLSGEYVVSVDKSRRAVLWSDI
ncbi:ATG16 autophagy related 16-like 2 isoform X3 [Sinocyclocheilus rhinocerous]|uniref:ATG16 autophagy related 16-like 2 isoform X3 n=1 Tax=Sinocyclocheilus rhinocerous TaxID=307959 RepID=UPI0007B95529|nr:PREDICTED: autophagy-related protein 16-2-like isoform X3 [Sinocyclocheilus rhinocerous]